MLVVHVKIYLRILFLLARFLLQRQIVDSIRLSLIVIKLRLFNICFAYQIVLTLNAFFFSLKDATHFLMVFYISIVHSILQSSFQLRLILLAMKLKQAGQLLLYPFRSAEKETKGLVLCLAHHSALFYAAQTLCHHPTQVIPESSPAGL